MTQETQGRTWLAVIFFGSIAVFFGYFLYFLVTGATDPAYNRWLEGLKSEPDIVSVQDSPIILPRNTERRIDGLKITYLGRQADSILLKFTILPLDPDYAYIRRIRIRQAQKRFRISEYEFKLISVNGREIRLGVLKK